MLVHLFFQTPWFSGFYDENIEIMFSGQLKKLEESMATDEEEIEKLRGEEKEKLKVCISKPLLVLILYSVLKDTGSCLIWFHYQLCQGYLKIFHFVAAILSSMIHACTRFFEFVFCQ